jgi:lysine biosynthesis protein LysW
MVKADCPSCGANVYVGSKPKLGQHIMCFACKTELEIVWLEPVELDWPYEDDYEDEIDEDNDFEDDD